ncbi:N-formylglutamate deformylase [Ramlibacter sp.]|uniref:N-formylglutamate deformylase n=1 Tax=Ramlibacter sp. TaxID=1917967 RepID=UPI002CE5038C|nr:N-formylglutamate deformylase [Ramlibacter sp.]HWI83820.1 N-formylglutamate deformylase [Ramlibacter sp.]
MAETAPAPFLFHQGTQPLLLSIPHMGTFVPPALAERLTVEARRVPDTDWHLDRLYAFARELGASVLQATHSRYVVDLNRPPDNASLYPGQATTGLCPTETFDGTPVYRDGHGVTEAEVAQRLDACWRPYHERLRSELDRIRAQHGIAMLWDAHSIRSVLPRFFEGKLPDLNLGTANGASCAPELARTVLDIACAAPGHTAVLNGRYTGGYITRRYGEPARGIHAVQLEMTQCSYMEEQWPFAYRADKAAAVQPHVRRMLEAVLAFARA